MKVRDRKNIQTALDESEERYRTAIENSNDGKGEEAVRSLGMILYDLVLMDVQMPEMDGYEATRVIRDPSSKVINSDVPIIAITAHAMSGDKKLCLDTGMNDYVSKPVNPEELLKTINKYISESGKTLIINVIYRL